MSDASSSVSGVVRHPLAFWLGTVPTRVLALISCIILFLMMVLLLLMWLLTRRTSAQRVARNSRLYISRGLAPIA